MTDQATPGDVRATRSTGSSVVLGYSGLHGSRSFRLRWLGLDADLADTRFYQGQDAAAALIVDGKLVCAVQEERFSGIKYDGDFPVRSIEWCLASAGVDAADITAVGHNFDYRAMDGLLKAPIERQLHREVYAPELQLPLLRAALPGLSSEIAVTPVEHHTAHALSAVSAADLDDAAVLVVDGLGELEAISMFRWHDGALTKMASQGARSSLGIFYALVTRHLGFLPQSDEYKVMGLAAQGDPVRFAGALEHAIRLTEDGVDIPVLDWSDGAHLYSGTREWLRASLFAARTQHDALRQVHADLAAAVQARLTAALFHLAEMASELCRCRRLVVVGGVALNCAAIGELARQGSFDCVYVPPAAGDDGSAIGAAVGACPDLRPPVWPALPLLGPCPAWERPPPTPDALLTAEECSTLTARLLREGAIVGWATGPLEFGPRALGNRSVLASPVTREMRDRINQIIKEREDFRPLAPAVLDEHADAWFEIPAGLTVSHMTATVRARSECRERVPAVIHADGTARVQSVKRVDHPRFWSLLDDFHRMTGIPMLLNTSLNLRGQPIAATADQAFDVFSRSEIDAIVIDHAIWVKPRFRAALRT
jgi:carbamoyltransferase